MSLSSSSTICFLQRNTISSSCGGTVRDKKRASSVMLWYREEEAEAGTNRKKKSMTVKQRSIDVDQYRDKKKRDSPARSRLGVTPLAILSGKFSPPRGSHHTAQMTGAVALPPRILVLVANTRDITRKVCAGGHCRSRLGKKRPRRTLRTATRPSYRADCDMFSRYIKRRMTAVAALKESLK